MTKGRPFTDPTFKPNGRPFNDPTHPNYGKFNPEPEVEEPEVPIEDVDDEPIAEDPVVDEGEAEVGNEDSEDIDGSTDTLPENPAEAAHEDSEDSDGTTDTLPEEGPPTSVDDQNAAEAPAVEDVLQDFEDVTVNEDAALIDMDMDGVPAPYDPDDNDPNVTEVLPDYAYDPNDPRFEDKGEPATVEDYVPTPPPEEEVIDKGEPATVEDPVEIITNGDPADDLIEEPPVTNEDKPLFEEYIWGETETLETVASFALVPEEDTITGTFNEETVVEEVDPLVPTVVGTDKGEKIKGTNKDDIIFGGLGADKFKTKKGNDIILDFQVGEDSLKGKFRDVELSVVDGSTLMDHKKGSVLFDGLELTAVDIFG